MLDVKLLLLIVVELVMLAEVLALATNFLVHSHSSASSFWMIWSEKHQ